jgi:hypothetical protein
MKKSTIVFILVVLVVLLPVLLACMLAEEIPVEVSLENLKELDIFAPEPFTVIDGEITYKSKFENGQYRVTVPNYMGSELKFFKNWITVFSISISVDQAGNYQVVKKLNSLTIIGIAIIPAVIVVLYYLSGEELLRLAKNKNSNIE